ncbi:hypothetical protein HNR23_001708 [Nocardiopsis mwathae]|uniref:Uncharacterized protein n=1 Tax=Nocardiopsis mwathae TaxID=1472723 RepID=A0A7X0D4X5_9ACTN|nr:hypothetical protein [Nocardiopsis mwathae]
MALHYFDAEAAAPSGVRWEHRTPEGAAAEDLASELDGAIAVAADLAASGVRVDAVAPGPMPDSAERGTTKPVAGTAFWPRAEVRHQASGRSPSIPRCPG